MRKTILAALAATLLAVVAPQASADRQYQLCDTYKSKLCAGLSALYEFEEASDYARTSEMPGALLHEPDGVNLANSATHKTGNYSFPHTAVANSYLYIPRSMGMSGLFTGSFWLYIDTKPSVAGKFVYIISSRDANGNAANPVVELYNTSGTTNVKYCVTEEVSDTVTCATGTAALSTATWYHVAFGQYPTPTSTNPYATTLWVATNAGTKVTATTTYPSRPIFGDTIVGGWLNSGNAEYGAYKIDQLAFWAAVLSPADLTNLNNSGNGKAFPFVD